VYAYDRQMGVARIAPFGVAHALQAWRWFHERVLVRGLGVVATRADAAYDAGYRNGFTKGGAEVWDLLHRVSRNASL
jgi:hypothetical protein